jgi:hypothetical protein
MATHDYRDMLDSMKKSELIDIIIDICGDDLEEYQVQGLDDIKKHELIEIILYHHETYQQTNE